MSTLVLAHESPLPALGGGALRILHQSRALAQHLDDEVTLVALGEVPPGVHEPFRLEGVPHSPSRLRVLATALRVPYVEVWSRSAGLDQVVAGRRWDLVVATSPFLLPAALRLGPPVVLDAANVESEVLATMAASDPSPLARRRWAWEADKVARRERQLVPLLQAVAAPSEGDVATYRALGSRRAVLSPNGVDVRAWAWQPPAGTHRLGYLGQYGYRPNEAAALELVDDVAPLVAVDHPDVQVVLIGRGPTAAMQARSGSTVEVTGAVDDLATPLRSLRVLVVPLRAGGGTRLKILEAMAAGVPVVSTPLGAAGIDVVDGTHLLLAERPDQLAAAVKRVLADDELALRLSRAGRALVEERYDWSVTARPLVACCAEVLAGRAAG
jgi:glycosyltransferase involved in cell wall biosynthesis